MGCICSGTDTINKQKRVPSNIDGVQPSINHRDENEARENRVPGERIQEVNNNANNIRNNSHNHRSENREPREHRENREHVEVHSVNNNSNNMNARLAQAQYSASMNSSSINASLRNRSQNNQMNQPQQHIPNYEPYLQSKHNPSFNMKELPDVTVGEGLKQMKGYVCQIEEDDLIRKRDDFWSSRYDGNPEVWELLKNFCIGTFSNKDLKELLSGSGLSPYAGCINVIYDSKGNLYEIPNYCIHDPSVWDVPKLKIQKPKEVTVQAVIRLGIEEYNIALSNLTKVHDLKKAIVKNLKIPEEYGEVTPEKIRLFHYGKEMKDKDYLFMHEVADGSSILMMVRRDVDNI